ncbi:alpha-glucosidase [Paenibacillus sp. DMB5]|uniref:glycoside hydrolase family 13 protein n=1 Tax=Paenibacillus sp. DMB5 TaxID=1780103 RepID=UPI00076D5E87|nr:alpha-glucosidase [Paenibacillus sp. DMB5]KUP24046.1 glucohydrolase [Paenibacillus sp. DMB5]
MYKTYWKESVVYEVYLRSFKDSDGDGIGDLNGLISKADYFSELGVDTIWLSPVYVSPNVDNGYDIKDYCAIQHEYGTMEQWEQLLDELHKRNIRLIMDLVLNHTSDEHPWFVEAKSSRDSRYRDFYIWRPAGDDGGPPNNWTSYLGKPAWTYDEDSGEYYLHLYNAKQPDLNWDNPELRAEMYKIMTFWLDKGIDGFRMDAINSISKDQRFPDTSKTKLQANGEPYTKNGPRIHEFLREMNDKVFSGYQIFTAGETSKVTENDVLMYTKPERRELSMVLSAEASKLADCEEDQWQSKEWGLDDLREVMKMWQKDVGEPGGWFGLYLSNHDQPRMVATFGDQGQYRVQSAKMLAILLHTLKGTPFILQGEELGMTNHPGLIRIEDFNEQQAHSYYDVMVKERGEPEELIMERIRQKSRDHARTPMQWDGSPNAGFTEGRPWLPVHPDYKEVNLKAQLDDPDSVFHFYKKLIRLRKEHPVMVYGDFDLMLEDHQQIFAYTRHDKAEEWLILLNFSNEEAHWKLPELEAERLLGADFLFGNYPGETEPKCHRQGTLKPYEGLVYRRYQEKSTV